MHGSVSELLTARRPGFAEQLRSTRLVIDGRYGVMDDHLVIELAAGLLDAWTKADELAMVGWVRRALAAWEAAALAGETFVGIAQALADEFARYMRRQQNELADAPPELSAQAALWIRRRAHATIAIATARLAERCSAVRAELATEGARG